MTKTIQSEIIILTKPVYDVPEIKRPVEGSIFIQTNPMGGYDVRLKEVGIFSRCVGTFETLEDAKIYAQSLIDYEAKNALKTVADKIKKGVY